VHIYVWNEWAQNRIKTPHIMGHEFAGHVVEAGRSVRGFSEGDFVSSETHIYCGHCYQCRTGHSEVCQNLQILGVDRAGAFAEYVAVPERVLWRNDDSVPAAWASIQEPMGNALDTVNSEPVAGKTVLVTGAGPIGILAVGIAKAFGATQLFVSDLSDYRLGLASRMGRTWSSIRRGTMSLPGFSREHRELVWMSSSRCLEARRHSTRDSRH